MLSLHSSPVHLHACMLVHANTTLCFIFTHWLVLTMTRCSQGMGEYLKVADSREIRLALQDHGQRQADVVALIMSAAQLYLTFGNQSWESLPAPPPFLPAPEQSPAPSQKAALPANCKLTASSRMCMAGIAMVPLQSRGNGVTLALEALVARAHQLRGQHCPWLCL